MFEYTKFDPVVEFLRTAEKRPRSIIDDTPYQKAAHWPSGLTNCIRKQAWDFTIGSEWNPSLNDDFTFAIGHAFEEVIVKRFKGVQAFLGEEESFTLKDERLKYPINGRVDIIVKLPPELDKEQLMRPVELKTMNSNQWEDKEYGPMKFAGASSKPKLYHVAQLTIYLKKMNVDWGLMCYANKNSSEIMIYKIDFSQEFYDFIINYLAEVESEVMKVREDESYIPRATTITDDFEVVDINDVPLTLYKRNTALNEIGDPKLDKMNKDEGIFKFPCVWQDANTKKLKTCDYFGKCYSDKLKELDLTMDDF